MARTLILIMLLTSLLYPFSESEAAFESIPAFNRPFGGKITKIQACKDPAGLLLTIGPPVGGKYLLTKTSQIHLYGVFMPGVWTLGAASPKSVTCRGNNKSLGGFAIDVATGALESFIPGIGAVNALASGDFVGGALGLVSLVDPTGITAVISLVSSLVGFPRRLHNLGSAHTILRIGTGATPDAGGLVSTLISI